MWQRFFFCILVPFAEKVDFNQKSTKLKRKINIEESKAYWKSTFVFVIRGYLNSYHTKWHCQKDFVFLRKNNQITVSFWSIDNVHRRHYYLNLKQWLFCVRISLIIVLLVIRHISWPHLFLSTWIDFIHSLGHLN